MIITIRNEEKLLMQEQCASTGGLPASCCKNKAAASHRSGDGIPYANNEAGLFVS